MAKDSTESRVYLYSQHLAGAGRQIYVSSTDWVYRALLERECLSQNKTNKQNKIVQKNCQPKAKGSSKEAQEKRF